jgi:hypothetical protein
MKSSPTLRLSLLVGAPLICLGPQAAASARPQSQKELLEGHSEHGEVFNEGPRQAAYLMPLPESVRFPVSVADEGLLALFIQVIGQLHGFWFF